MDPQVPPFCVWGDDPDEKSRAGIQPAIQSRNPSDEVRREWNAACLARIKLALRKSQRFLVSQLKEEFPQLDLDLGKPASTRDGLPHASRFSDRAQILATDFCAAASSTLGAFVDSDPKAFPILKHYLNSLSRLLRVRPERATRQCSRTPKTNCILDIGQFN